MERLPHVFLVGHGADRFAAEMGYEKTNLLTKEAHRVWEQRVKNDMPDEVFNKLADQPDLWKWVEMATDPERTRGTVNFLAKDESGQHRWRSQHQWLGLEISGPTGGFPSHWRGLVR